MPAPPSGSSLDPASLLDSADEWRATAARSSETGDWDAARAALQMAESSYDSAIAVLPEETNGAVVLQLKEGRALCTVLRSDFEMRHWKLGEAETYLDEAYKAFKELEEGVIGAELWRVTARIAERRGRWVPALAAWKRVIKLTDGQDELALADAQVRAAEVQLIRGNAEAADAFLTEVETLARELEDDLLRSRVSAVRAADLESRRQYDAAWEAWQDAEAVVRAPPNDYLGLLQLRMAGTAIWLRPRQAFKLVEAGHAALVDARHPDALGLAYHQLAVLCLAVRDAGAAALCAVGTSRQRGGFDDASRPLLAQALKSAGHADLGRGLEADAASFDDAAIQEALSETLARLSVAWTELDSAAALAAICRAQRQRGGSKAAVRVEDGWTAADTRAIVRHRATLTWDAPVATLATVVKAELKAAPTPPPALPRMPRRQSRPVDGPHTIPSTPPPARLTDRSRSPAPPVPLLLVGALVGILVVSGFTVIGVALLLQYLAA